MLLNHFQIDVFSFGVLLCEMCIREYPEHYRRGKQVDEMSNRALQELVRQCLQTNPDDRPDMTEIIGKLEQLQEVQRETCHTFKERNVSFNTKDFLKQLAQSHTFQYLCMSRRETGISQSNTSFSSWRVIHLYYFFSVVWFSYVFGVFLQVTIDMALKFLTESSLYGWPLY